MFVLICIQVILLRTAKAKFRSRAIDQKCKVPCQLEPYWITFDRVLEMSELPPFLHSFIRPKSDKLIDVGKCIGHCSASHTPLYHHTVRLICVLNKHNSK